MLWKATKRLKQPMQRSPTIQKTDNDWARSNKEKSQEFAEYFSNVFQPFPPEITTEEGR